MCVQACCGNFTSATRGCRCWDSWWQWQASDVIDMSEAKQPKQPLHINPPCPQAYKYQHAAGWTQTIRHQPWDQQANDTAADLQLRLLVSDSVSVQMLCSSCVLSVLVLQLLLEQTCSVVLPSRNERVRVAPATACKKPIWWLRCENYYFSLEHFWFS